LNLPAALPAWLFPCIADGAKGILLVPSDRPGTLWEIDTLRQEGLLGKVIFVMPPSSAGQHDTRQRWESARQALSR
jgi:hypothetical protein